MKRVIALMIIVLVVFLIGCTASAEENKEKENGGVCDINAGCSGTQDEGLSEGYEPPAAG